MIPKRTRIYIRFHKDFLFSFAWVMHCTSITHRLSGCTGVRCANKPAALQHRVGEGSCLWLTAVAVGGLGAQLSLCPSESSAGESRAQRASLGGSGGSFKPAISPRATRRTFSIQHRLLWSVESRFLACFKATVWTFSRFFFSSFFLMNIWSTHHILLKPGNW